MQLTARDLLVQFSQLLQNNLFPAIEQVAGTLSSQARLLVSITGLVPLHRFLPYTRGYEGRPLQDRQALACAFIAKAVYGMQTTRQLIERLQADAQLRSLCGWNSIQQLPHESTFSRAFAEFAKTELPQRIHEALIIQTQGQRLIGHIARDATAIVARERFPEPPAEPKRVQKRKRGRPKKGDTSLPAKRLERQRQQTLAQMLEELPTACDVGVKTASDGNQRYWRGHKLHIDVADGQIPISCILTSASVHDSQVAIPLATMTAARVTSLYDLMDAAYDAHHIREHSRSLGHVPIIAVNQGLVPITNPKAADSMRGYDKRRKLPKNRPRRTPPLELAEKQRYRERTMSERVNARLKEEFGASHIRVRGAEKVMAHLMFGVLALTVDQLLKFVIT